MRSRSQFLNVVDVLSGMALSVVIPTKARTPYTQAELRRFVLETGRTFGVLQADPEPALLAIATSVTGEVGGVSFRKMPVGWKQAQGSVGNMQPTLYGQIKALRLEILERYDVDLSVHSALFTWLVCHAQWLVNRSLPCGRNDSFRTALSMPALYAALERLYFSAAASAEGSCSFCAWSLAGKGHGVGSALCC